MKKIINGKKYNTGTAEKMGGHDNGYAINDFNHVTETLYRKKTGEFFLHGEGGGLSRYASSCGDSMGWGEQIIPLTEKEAEEWAEARLEVDDYEAIFGEVREDYSDKFVNLTITARSHEVLRRLQSRTGKTMGEIMDELIKVEGEKYNL